MNLEPTNIYPTIKAIFQTARDNVYRQIIQEGKDRAKYGSYLIQELSKQLSELSWSQYKLLIHVKDDKARAWYMKEAVRSNWSVRALERQIRTHYYEHLLSSQDKNSVVLEAKEKTKDLVLTPKDMIKDPYVLEFLELKRGNHA